MKRAAIVFLAVNEIYPLYARVREVLKWCGCAIYLCAHARASMSSSAISKFEIDHRKWLRARESKGGWFYPAEKKLKNMKKTINILGLRNVRC